MLNNILNIIQFLLIGYYFINAIPIFRINFILKIYIKTNELILFFLAFLSIYWTKNYSFSVETLYLLLISAVITLLYLPLMILLTSAGLDYFLKFKYKLFEWIKDLFHLPRKYLKRLVLSFFEELIWRVAFVFLLHDMGVSDLLIFVSGSILFYLIHLSFSKKIIILTELELFLFSCLLYAVYLSTNSLLSVWLIHFLRNSYLQFSRTKTTYA